MKIIIQRAKNYANPVNCGIAKGLRRKLIIAIVTPTCYTGLFLGIIPIWGSIPQKANDIAHNCTREDFIPVEAEVGFYDKIKNEEQW
jgi:hypothetical protein